MDYSVYLRMGNAPTCPAPHYVAHYSPGDNVEMISGGLAGQVLQRNFMHGQFQYYVVFTDKPTRPRWVWEGYLQPWRGNHEVHGTGHVGP